MTPRVLVLGGTLEARDLCAALVRSGHDTIASLAGLTSNPAHFVCPVRSGGFGGPDGLAEWLSDNGITALIDATHPHAANMPRHADAAGRAINIPVLHLKRRPWPVRENWQCAESLNYAVRSLPPNARAFLATGAFSANHFGQRSDVHFILRSIEPVRAALPPANTTFITARPPFSLDCEKRTFREHAITHLVAKNSGGASGAAKLDAADALDIKVVLIGRPQLPKAAVVVESVTDAAAWLTGLGLYTELSLGPPSKAG